MIDIGTKIILEDGALKVGRFQDCTPIAEYAKARSKEGNVGSSDMKFAASIPFVIVEKYCNDHGITFQECMHNSVHMKRIVNDPANADFRIWKGRV